MRILFTLHHPLDEYAGAPGATAALARAYRELGHEAAIYSHDDLPPRLGGRARDLLFPWAVYAHLRRDRSDPPDVVDSSTGDTWLWASIPRRGARPLIVVRSHGLEHDVDAELREEARRGNLHLSLKHRLYHRGVRLREVARSLRAADLAIFVNSRDRDFAVERLRVRPEDAAVVPNGIPESLLGLEVEPTPPPGSSVGVAFVGSYIPRKGVVYVRQAVTALLHRHQDVRMTFLGTGVPSSEVLADYEQALHDRIRVVPAYQRDALPSLLRGFQVQLFPSIAEGFGMALVEGMACGLAPVVTPTRGALETVRHEIEGLVAPMRDGRALADAVEHLLADRALLDRLRRSAHATVQELGWGRIAEQTLELYRERLDRAKPSRAERRAVERA